MAPTEYQAAVDSYLADCRRRGLRPATIRYYRMALERIGASCEVSDPRDLTVARIRNFQDDASLGATSVRGYLRAARTFTRWLADEGVVRADGLARLRLPRVDQHVVVAPTDDELIELLRASGLTLRVVLALLMGTGLRISDMTLLLRSSLRPGELVVASTKNRAGRLVPLDPVLETLLLRQASAAPGGSGPLFVSRTGRPLTADAVRLVLADARRLAGLPVRVSPHVIRHWHARDLGAHGTTDRLLSARMGWRSPTLVGLYAPVALHELRLDVARYAPLVRLRDEGRLDGIFPPAILVGATTLAKNDSSRDGAVTTRPGRSRQS